MTEYIITVDETKAGFDGNIPISAKQEVVRCRDCKQHYRMWGDRLLCAITHRRVKPDGFCAWGERV